MEDGDCKTNESTRAERGGRVGILAVLIHFAKSFNLTKGHITILIDNQQALRYGTCPRQGDGSFKHLANNYDLKCWSSIFEQDLKRNHNIILDYQYVYSHQDDSIKLMKIHLDLNLAQAKHMAKHSSVYAKVNIACDKEAERGHTLFHGKQNNNPIIPNKVGAVLEVEGKHIFRNMKEKIFHISHAPELMVYLEKFEWGEYIHEIDWESHEKAHQTLPTGRRFLVSKVLFNWLPTNSRLFSWVPPQHPHPFCPICEDYAKTNDHIFQCSHPISRTAQVQCLEK